MTNQTIDGVPRDDLELVLLHGHSTHESDRAWDRLRALLDAPPRCPVCGYTEQDCREQMDHYLCGSPEPAPANKRAAQPQGDSTRWERLYHQASADLCKIGEALGVDEDDQCLPDILEAIADLKSKPQVEPVAWLNVATDHVTTSAVVVMDWDDEKEQVQSLYAEQPAPVAVVLPERREPTQDVPYLSDADHEWNACIKEVAFLNTK